MIKDRRVKLSSGKQRELILNLGEKFGSIRKLAQELVIPYSTMKNYSLEVSFLPENLFERIVDLSQINKSELDFSYLQGNWGQLIGGRAGMVALEKKYPDKIKVWRMQAMKKAIETGKHYGYSNMKQIKYPGFDEKLAEFIGAYLGDGTLTKYFVKISGDCRYDFLYYEYLSKLVFELFGIRTVIRKESDRNTNGLIVQSKNVCTFLHDRFGLEYGHKIRNKTVIPEQILESRKLTIACLRGLIDTDGSVSRRGRGGSQFCIQFTAHNKFLLSQVIEIGKKLGLFTFVDKTGTGTNKWDNIVKYFRLVGSSNMKHIVRFHLRSKGNTIYRSELPKYFRQSFYRNLNLPYKEGGAS